MNSIVKEDLTFRNERYLQQGSEGSVYIQSCCDHIHSAL